MKISFLLLASFVLAHNFHDGFALVYRGSCTSSGCALKATSEHFKTVVSYKGAVKSSWEVDGVGTYSTFTTNVTSLTTGDSEMSIEAAIDFGIHRSRPDSFGFSCTIHYTVPLQSAAFNVGSCVGEITQGQGTFAGAAGYVTVLHRFNNTDVDAHDEFLITSSWISGTSTTTV
jgi:hypothetical protein